MSITCETPRALLTTVRSTATGILYTVERMLGSTSTLSLIAGTDANLSLVGSDVSADAVVGAGETQIAQVREVLDDLSIEYPVTLVGILSGDALGPTVASFENSAAAGTLVAAFTGLDTGETVTAVSPNDGRIAIAGGGTQAVVGITASSAGTTTYSFTTSAGRVLTAVITTTAVAIPVTATAPSATGTPGSILTMVPGTFSGTVAGQTDDWLVDWIPYSGSTLDTSTLVGMTVIPRSTATNASGSTTSLGTPISIPGSPYTTVKYDDFNTADTSLSSRGWTILNSTDANANKMLVSSNKATYAFAGQTVGLPQGAVVDTSSINHSSEFVQMSSSFMGSLIVGALNKENFFFISNISVGSGVWYIAAQKRVGGVASGITGGVLAVPIPNMTTDRWRFEIKAKQLFFYVNDVQYKWLSNTTQASVPTVSDTGAGLDISGSGLTTGTFAGFMPGNFNSIDNAKVSSLSLPWGVLTANDTNVLPTVDDGRTIQLAGVYTGPTPTGVDVGVVDNNGVTLLSRTAASSFTASGGSWTAQFSSEALLGTNVDGKTIHVQAWPIGAPTSAGKSIPLVAAVYAEIKPYRAFMNLNVENDSKRAHTFRDLVKQATWRNGFNKYLVLPYYFIPETINPGVPGASYATTDAQNCSMDLDGIIYGQAPGSSVVARLCLPLEIENDCYGKTYRLAGIPRGWSVTVTSNVTIGAHSAGTVSGATFTSTASGRGWDAYVDLVINSVHPTLGGGYLDFNGSFAAIGDSVPGAKDGGFNRFLTMKRVDDTSDLKTADNLINLNAQGFRFMQRSLVSGAPAFTGGLTPALRWKGDCGGFPTKVEHAVDICNDANADLFWSFTDTATDACIEEELTYIRDNLKPGLKLYTEHSNEMWNTAWPYIIESVRCMTEGIRRGWDVPPQTVGENGTDTIAVDRPVVSNVTQYGDGTVNSPNDGNPPTTLVSRAENDILVGIWWGPGGFPTGTYALKVTQAISANSQLNSTNCTPLCTATQARVARERYHCFRSVRIGEIAYDVFGASAPERVVRGFGAHQLQSGTNIAQQLEWNQAYQKIDAVYVGPYFDNWTINTIRGETKGRDLLGTYTAPSPGSVQTISGWTTTEHALYSTDPGAWANYCLTGTADASGSVVNGPMYVAAETTAMMQAQRMHEMERTLRSRHANPLAADYYTPNQVGWSSYEIGHNIQPDAGYSNATARNTAMQTLANSARMYDVMKGFHNLFARWVGGSHAAFSLQEYVTNSMWSYWDGPNDQGDPRIRGWQDGRGPTD